MTTKMTVSRDSAKMKIPHDRKQIAATVMVAVMGLAMTLVAFLLLVRAS